MRVAFAYIGAEVLGIEILSAQLKQRGHEVRLFYDPSLFDDKTIFSMPSMHRVFDIRPRMIEDLVAFEPDIVAFSVLTNTYRWSLEVAEIIKQRLDVPVIFGGVHPTVVPELVIKRPEVDIINLGEGYESLPELVSAIERGQDYHHIRNLWVKDGDTVIRNEIRPTFHDLDALPHADKKLFAGYFDVGSIYLMITGLGCPYRCTFCSNDLLMDMYEGKGRYIRRRSVDDVIAELVQAKKIYRLRMVKFVDDIFTLNMRWLEEFAERYPREIGVPYYALSHPDHVNDKSARLLKASGCHRLELGVQSVNEETKRVILDRPETKEQMANAFACCERHGIHYLINHMFGIPTEGEAQQREASRFYADFRPSRIGSYYLKYLPRTRIADIAAEQGLIGLQDVREFEQGYFATVHSAENIERDLLRVFKNHETLNLLMPLLPRWVNRRLARSRIVNVFHWVPSFVRTLLDVFGAAVHNDHETRLFALYYFKMALKVIGIKMGLKDRLGMREPAPE